VAWEEERKISPAIRHFDEALDLEERQAKTCGTRITFFELTIMPFHKPEFGLL